MRLFKKLFNGSILNAYPNLFTFKYAKGFFIMSQYEDLCRNIVDNGTWVENKRTGKRCLTLINADLQYNVGAGEFPLVTTRKSYWKAAIAEFLGYIRGYETAEQFRSIIETGPPAQPLHSGRCPVTFHRTYVTET